MRNLTMGTEYESYFMWFAYAAVMIMALPPIIASFRAIKNNHGWLYTIGFMVLPLVVLGGYGFALLNTLLKNGFLADVWIMGTPLFITLHTGLMLILLLLFFRRHLFSFVKDNGRTLVMN